jgi:hypothetical protein
LWEARPRAESSADAVRGEGAAPTKEPATLGVCDAGEVCGGQRDASNTARRKVISAV